MWDSCALKPSCAAVEPLAAITVVDVNTRGRSRKGRRRRSRSPVWDHDLTSSDREHDVTAGERRVRHANRLLINAGLSRRAVTTAVRVLGIGGVNYFVRRHNQLSPNPAPSVHVGRSTRSTMSTSTCCFSESSPNPSCSRAAVKTDTASGSVGLPQIRHPPVPVRASFPEGGGTHISDAHG